MIEEVRVVLRRLVCDVKGCGFIGDFHTSRITLAEEMKLDGWAIVPTGQRAVCPDCVADEMEGKRLEFYQEDETILSDCSENSTTERSFAMHRLVLEMVNHEDLTENKVAKS